MSDPSAIRVDVAVIDDLVRLETGLFTEDAGTHDSLVDVDWPVRHAREDFGRLLHNESALVLVARYDGTVSGHLVGYLSSPSPTRFDRRNAEIRSLYVDTPVRSTGVGQALVAGFVAWARAHEAVAVGVTAYAGNTSARAFYRKLGFAEQSVVLRLPL